MWQQFALAGMDVLGSSGALQKQPEGPSSADSAGMATGGTITGSPVFINGDGARVNAASSPGSMYGGTGGGALDFQRMALWAGVAVVGVIAFAAMRGKR